MSLPTDSKIIIAIDGHSSGGKSTFARELAARLGYIFIDTGAMYRAMTLHVLEQGAVSNSTPNTEKIIKLLENTEIGFAVNDQTGRSEVCINGRPVEELIRSVEVSDLVSAVSSIPQVREKLVAAQKKLGGQKGIVMDGRDIGTVVFPDAELKIFLTADPAVRAKRRFNELKTKGIEVTLGEIERNINERDRKDAGRKVSPLKCAEDALVLDNSEMTLEDQIAWAAEKLSALGIELPRQ